MANMHSGKQKAIEAAGGITALARKLGIDHNVIRRWHDVPDHWIIKIEEATHVPRHELRPDLFDGYRRIIKMLPLLPPQS